MAQSGLDFRVCRVCGCTEKEPCVDGDGRACAWIEDDLCDFCADAEQPMVQVYSEGDMNAFLRGAI